MSYSPAAGDLYQINHNMNLGLSVAQMTQYVVVASNVGGGVTEQNFADNLSTQFGLLIKNVMTNHAAYAFTRIQRIKPLPKLNAVDGSAGATVGTGGTAPSPPQCAGIFTLFTGFAGRAGRGRRYVPYPDDSFITSPVDATPTSAYKANVALLGTLFVGTLTITSSGNTLTATNVVFARKTSISTPITSGFVRGYFATQRRRSLVARV